MRRGGNARARQGSAATHAPLRTRSPRCAGSLGSARPQEENSVGRAPRYVASPASARALTRGVPCVLLAKKKTPRAGSGDHAGGRAVPPRLSGGAPDAVRSGPEVWTRAASRDSRVSRTEVWTREAPECWERGGLSSSAPAPQMFWSRCSRDWHCSHFAGAFRRKTKSAACGGRQLAETHAGAGGSPNGFDVGISSCAAVPRTSRPP